MQNSFRHRRRDATALNEEGLTAQIGSLSEGAGERSETEGVLSFKRGAQGGLPAFTRGKAGGNGTLAPLLRVSLGGGQTVPRLNAHTVSYTHLTLPTICSV